MQAEAGATRPPAQEPRKLEAAGRTLPLPRASGGRGPRGTWIRSPRDTPTRLQACPLPPHAHPGLVLGHQRAY